jgi:hypothetical protein
MATNEELIKLFDEIAFYAGDYFRLKLKKKCILLILQERGAL